MNRRAGSSLRRLKVECILFSVIFVVFFALYFVYNSGAATICFGRMNGWKAVMARWMAALPLGLLHERSFVSILY